jgi:hypothetical protein
MGNEQGYIPRATAFTFLIEEETKKADKYRFLKTRRR